ncbi:MAG TPA: sphingosine kinase [Bacillus bacterium]|nr:sphingosine kinase [Bacillus sp. (in: firmicutes)]
MKKAIIIVNPSSGKEKARDYAEKTENILSNQYSDIVTRLTESEGDAASFAREACQEGVTAVIVMGGDGTVNEAINGISDQTHRPRLGIVPLGTINDFARALDIPLEPYEAISILKTQSTKSVDIGKINDAYFANVLAVGALAEASYNVTAEQKTRFGPLAYFMESAKSFLGTETIQLRVEHEKGSWEGESFLLLAALTNSVGGFETLAPDAEVNDGKLHVFIVKQFSFPKIAKIIPSLLKGDLKESEEVEYVLTSFLNVSSTTDHMVNIDGEEGQPLPFSANVLPGHLNVFVPETKE